jgi:pantetheine-phosphate adenylyltransferase
MGDILEFPKIGIYCGSFRPLHVGHLDVIKQAIEIFPTLIVAQSINNSKVKTLLPNNQFVLPVQFLTTFRHDVDIKVDYYDTLLIDYIKKMEEDYNVTLIRGIRNGNDLEYEQNLIAFIREKHPRVKIAYFMARSEFSHISSSALREIRNFSEHEYRKYVVN